MLIRWSDFAGHRNNNLSIFNDLQKEMDQVFRELSPIFQRNYLDQPTQYPQINMYDREDDLLLIAEVPGMKQEELEIQANAEGLTLKGERKRELPEETNIYLNERSSFKFERNFSWPMSIDLEAIEANLKDGLLQISIKKAPEAKPRHIEIKAL